jgi:hypothetical protein
VRPLLQSVHEGEQLGDNAALNLAVSLLSLGRDCVEFIDEDDGRGVLLGLFERLAEVGLGFA